MTKDEAIRILKNAAWLGSNDEREAIEEAVDMVVDVLRDCDKCATEAINIINLLHNALKDKWIPCSERLPDNDGDIIMTTDTRHVVVGFHSDGAWYYINKEGTLSRSYDEENAIVAWMVLPERYKGGK